MPDTTQLYSLTKEKIFELFQTSDKGLSSEAVKTLLSQFGPNRLTVKRKISALSIYIAQFKNTLTLILIASALLMIFIYYFGGRDKSDLVEAGLILAIILMITILGFLQEYKAEKAIESLKKLLAYRAKVRRDGKEIEIDIVDLVPGDIVILEEGTKIPADMRLLEVFNMRVVEASLTGEAAPVTKSAEILSGIAQIGDQTNMVFAGTAIASGRGIGVVVKTGDYTEIGKIAQDVAETEEGETPIEKRLGEIGKIIGYVILGICTGVFIFVFFFAKDFSNLPFLQKIIQSFIASVALAVAAIPESLPAVVTISLALGTQRMLRKNALIRKLNSVETLGSVDIICSDKTGTLTKGEMTVKKIYSEGKLYDVSGTGYETTGEFSLNGEKIDPASLSKLLETGMYCNNASISQEKVLGDPTEAALLVSAMKAKINSKKERVREIPFSSERKIMTVVVKNGDSYFVYSKGAPEIILKLCKISPEQTKEIFSINQELSNQALRNLGFAYKELSESDYKAQEKDEKRLESGLTFLGIQGMIDPPRVEVKPLIEICNKSGIRTILITGDHGATAKAVAHEIGIAGEVLTEDDLDKMSKEGFEKAVEEINIYARINPGTKLKIVDALQRQGHIVSMTGDGVNDAPALKKSDIGVAMGITGTDVAKEASDMILLDDKFSTIFSSIEEGRGIFQNIRKFVTYMLSCNVAEVMVVFVVLVLFQKLPLSATMLLWINFVTDGIPAIALGLDPTQSNIMDLKPKFFQSQIINRRLWVEMIVFGILLTAAVVGIYVLNAPEGIRAQQGAAFTGIVCFELVYIFLIRDDYKTKFLSNKWLFISIFVTFFLQLVIMHSRFLADLFEIKPIDSSDWLYILGASIGLWFIFNFIERILDRIPSVNSD